MMHLDDATLVAVRDGEPHEPELGAHLRECLPCRTRLAEAEARAAAIADLLSEVPGARGPVVAKARVRRRLDADRSREERILPRSLRRAAAILLVTAGAVYAVPRVPVPDWLSAGADDGVVPATEVAVPNGADGAGVPQEAVLVAVGGSLEVTVEDVPAGGSVELIWLDGSSAWIAAGPGASYSVGDASATIRAARGPVRIGVPRSTAHVVLRINGDIAFEGNVQDGDSERMLFSAPGA